LTDIGDYSEQIRLRTLLKDDVYYRQWFQKEPTIRVYHTKPPWRLFVQKEKGGSWFKRDYRTYPEAYAAVRLKLSEYWDMTIHCKPQSFKPPVVKVGKQKVWNPLPPGHLWCAYCRRPTVFKFYRRHPNMGVVMEGEMRCQICGVRDKFLPHYPITGGWPLHVVRSTRSTDPA
jgi:hypothetical protein